MSPFTPDQFKYSFTVKYVGLLRQVFNPLSMRSKIHCNGYTGLRDFAVAWTVWNGHLQFPSHSSRPSLLSFPYLAGCKFLLLQWHGSKVISVWSWCQVRLHFPNVPFAVNPTSRRSRTYDHTDPDDYSNTMIWASLPVYLPYIRIRKLGIHPPQPPAPSHCSSWHNRHCFFLLTSWRVALERTPGYHWLCIHVVWHALHSNLLIS